MGIGGKGGASYGPVEKLHAPRIKFSYDKAANFATLLLCIPQKEQSLK